MNRRGLYAIADTATIGDADFERAVRAALAGGAVAVQYRDKRDDAPLRRDQARRLVGACREAGAVAIINDDIELARSVAADGVHVGGEDAPAADARTRLGPDAVIGVSCYDSLERARAAQAAGASYVAFGRVLPSSTKANDVRAPLELLARARTETGLTICAIGGITAEDAPPIVAAGADLLAVVADLFGRSDIERRARDYEGLFDRD